MTHRSTDPGEVGRLLGIAFRGSDVEVEDLTGEGDHFRVAVTWNGFEGLSPLERHGKVHHALAELLDANVIHALSIRVYTPDEAARDEERAHPEWPEVPHDLVQHGVHRRRG